MEEKEKKKVVPIVIEGLEINSQNLTFQKLQEFTLILFEKLLNQRKERSFLTLERDKLKTIFENTRHEIKVSNAILTNKDSEMELAQARYYEKVKENDQEALYIEYDHIIRLNDLTKLEKSIMTKAEEENLQEESELLQEKRQLKENLAAENLTCVENLKNIKKRNIEDFDSLKEKLKELQVKRELEFKGNFDSIIEHLTLKHEMEMFELEESKNTHLAQLKLINTNRIYEMKSFFNSIISENLAVISDLKQNISVLKKNKGLMSDETKYLTEENKILQELADKARSKVNTLKRQLINYKKDLVSLKNNKFLLDRTKKDTIDIKLTSISKLKKIEEEEISSLQSSNSHFFSFASNSSSTTVSKRYHLEGLILELIKEVRNKQKIVKDLSCYPDNKKVLSKLKFVCWNPRKLSYEVALMCKAHDDLLKTLREKLQELCVPEEMLENTLLSIANIGKTASLFVSKQRIKS